MFGNRKYHDYIRDTVIHTLRLSARGRVGGVGAEELRTDHSNVKMRGVVYISNISS